MSTVKLKRLKINKYRNVRPGTELHFDGGVNLVLGQNGSGKTTLLGLLSMICGWYFAELEDEEFDLEFEVHLNAVTTWCTLANHLVEDSAATGVLLYSYEIRWSDDRLKINGMPGSVTFQHADSEVRAAPCSPFKHDFLQYLTAALPSDAFGGRSSHLSALLTIALLRVHNAPFRFDESLGCYYALTGVTAPPSAPAAVTSRSISVTCILDLQDRPPRVVIRPHQGPFGTPQWVLAQLFAKAGPDWAPFDAFASSQIPFLAAAAEIMGFHSAVVRPVNPSAAGPINRRKVSFAGFDFSFMRRDGTSFVPHQQLSYGQKRLLAFFYYLACNDAFIIADELVNGLHHHWVKACVDAIGERQAFLTSQNPLLFDYVRFESIEQVQSAFITCKTEIVDGAEQLVWQNMPRDDAESFFRGYQADIESVGDILINRGLW